MPEGPTQIPELPVTTLFMGCPALPSSGIDLLSAVFEHQTVEVTYESAGTVPVHY